MYHYFYHWMFDKNRMFTRSGSFIFVTETYIRLRIYPHENVIMPPQLLHELEPALVYKPDTDIRNHAMWK